MLGSTKGDQVPKPKLDNQKLTRKLEDIFPCNRWLLGFEINPKPTYSSRVPSIGMIDKPLITRFQAFLWSCSRIIRIMNSQAMSWLTMNTKLIQVAFMVVHSQKTRKNTTRTIRVLWLMGLRFKTNSYNITWDFDQYKGVNIDKNARKRPWPPWFLSISIAPILRNTKSPFKTVAPLLLSARRWYLQGRKR